MAQCIVPSQINQPIWLVSGPLNKNLASSLSGFGTTKLTTSFWSGMWFDVDDPPFCGGRNRAAQFPFGLPQHKCWTLGGWGSWTGGAETAHYQYYNYCDLCETPLCILSFALSAAKKGRVSGPSVLLVKVCFRDRIGHRRVDWILQP